MRAKTGHKDAFAAKFMNTTLGKKFSHATNYSYQLKLVNKYLKIHT